ncbi:MAG: hypothetical protein LBM77_12495 [Spirochaetaceae bacterium]|jgi:hypothetical protein|nr:hypothetical protein [Spirochaetaceae bacterium]
MKILLVAADDKTAVLIKGLSFLPAMELIQYASTVKAMDNIDEIAPDAIVFSAIDFPQSWQCFASFLQGKTRMMHSAAAPKLILYTANADTIDKSIACELGINAVVSNTDIQLIDCTLNKDNTVSDICFVDTASGKIAFSPAAHYFGEVSMRHGDAIIHPWCKFNNGRTQILYAS